MRLANIADWLSCTFSLGAQVAQQSGKKTPSRKGSTKAVKAPDADPKDLREIYKTAEEWVSFSSFDY